MRLKNIEIEIIEKAIYSIDPEASIYLFGSRVDENRKGGDIDLLIFSRILTYGDKIKIKKQLFEEMESFEALTSRFARLSDVIGNNSINRGSNSPAGIREGEEGLSSATVERALPSRLAA